MQESECKPSRVYHKRFCPHLLAELTLAALGLEPPGDTLTRKSLLETRILSELRVLGPGLFRIEVAWGLE